MVQKYGILRKQCAPITRAVSQGKIELLVVVEGALAVEALGLVVVDQAQQDHFVYLVYMLVDYQAVEFVDKEIEFVLTLDFVVLFGEDLTLDLGLTDLRDCWEQQYESDNNHN